jgi:energy-coupling factor transporter transmembrane protein EcfT
MLLLLMIWLAACAALLLVLSRQHPSAGMPLAYFLGLSLIHTPGAAIYINFPDWDQIAEQTMLGYEQTVIGLVSFVFGVAIVRWRGIGLQPGPARWFDQTEMIGIRRLSLLYLAGGVSYFLVTSYITIPSIGALISSLSSLLIAGISLRVWIALRDGNAAQYWGAILLLPLLPIVTMVKDGFIGWGTYWLLAGASFVFSQSKRRKMFLVLAPLVIFFGLSVLINWMAGRAEYRKAAWMGHSGLEENVGRVSKMFSNFEWFNGENPKHREVINGRLNQNVIVGSAVERLESGTVKYAYGSTLGDMIVGLVPRAIWPNKPAVGGGGTVVQDYAGIKYGELTSVGAGQVLEFYINFGTLGVIAGFLIYGGIIGFLDLSAITALNGGNHGVFLRSLMMCLAMLQPGGNLVEIVVSVAGCFVTAKAIEHLIIFSVIRKSLQHPTRSAARGTMDSLLAPLPEPRGRLRVKRDSSH